MLQQCSNMLFCEARATDSLSTVDDVHLFVLAGLQSFLHCKVVTSLLIINSMATHGNNTIISTSTGPGLDTRITMEAASTLVCSKLSFYQAMVANKFIMPNYKEKIVTIKFMTQARENVLWLPKRAES